MSFELTAGEDASGYWIQGFIDRIARARDGAIEIQDYKTSARLPSQANVDDDRQLALYQIGVGERFGARAPGAAGLALPAPAAARSSRRARPSSSAQLAARRAR